MTRIQSVFKLLKRVGFALLLLGNLKAIAQPPELLWEEEYDQDHELVTVVSIVQTIDSGFICATTIDWTSTGYYSGALRKVRSNGETEWYHSRLFPSDSSTYLLKEFIALSTGDFAGIGYSWDSEHSIMLSGFSNTGDSTWSILIGNANDEPKSLLEGGHRDLWAIGVGSQGITRYPVVSRIDSNHNIQFYQRYPEIGVRNQRIVSTISNDSELILCLSGIDSTLYGGVPYMRFVRIDTVGNMSQVAQFGQDGNPLLPAEIVHVAGGEYWVCCENTRSLFKFSETLDLLFELPLDDDVYPLAHNLIPQPDGGIVFAWEWEQLISPPTSVYTVFLGRLDAHGDSIWTTDIINLDHDYLAPRICKTFDRGYACAWKIEELSSTSGIACFGSDSTGTGITDSQSNPSASIALLQNYPNPFNSTTIIPFELSRRQLVSLSLFDILGRRQAILINDVLDAGNYLIPLDAGNLPSGSYFCVLRTSKSSHAIKTILIK